MDEVREDALKLIEALWESVDWKSYARIRAKVYSMFTSWIQDAAYTGDLAKFIARFHENSGGGAISERHVPAVSAILSKGRDREILRVLRHEAPALVVVMRDRRLKTKGGDKGVREV